MTNNNLYNEDSIKSLSPRDFTRLRPGVYCGSTENSDQLLIEIVSNTIDEHKANHGDKIDVIIDDKNNSYSVRDYGQGFLVNSFREDGKTILQASFDTLNTSGKFTEDGVYEGTALGLNGIGSKLTNFLSHKLEVQTWRDGETEINYFEEGIFINRSVNKSKEPNGTYVHWQPSEEFFTHTTVNINRIRELFKVLTCLCKGFTINLDYNGKKEIFVSKNGLNDLIDDKVKDNEIISNRFNLNYENGKNKIDLVLTYTSNYSSNFISYVNTGETDSGPHLTQIKTILTRELNKFFREKGWLKEKEENLTGDDLQEGIVIAFNITAPGVSYDAQTKSRIVKIDMSPFTNAIIEALGNWFLINEKDIKLIADKALAARRAREAAKKARDAARTKSEKKKKALKFDSKLADCNDNGLNAEIIITEGDSASGNLKLARNKDYQAILPVRGKILNVRKASLDKIQKNAEIMTMIDAFGLKVDTKTMKLTYDKDDLRYGKIIIMSDADVSNTAYERLFA